MKNKFLKNLFCIIVIFTVILSILVIPASAADDSSDTMLIEAGTYRWNDTISSFVGDTPQISFTIPDFTIEFDDESFTFSFGTFNNINLIDVPDPSLYYFNLDANGDFVPSSIYVNNELFASPSSLNLYYQGFWDIRFVSDSSNISISEEFGVDISQYVRLITIIEDTYVPTNFGLWANENWKKQGEEEEPDTCPTLVDYLADFNDTYIDGILYTEGEAFMDYLLDADIDLHTSIYDYVVGDLIIDELRLLNPSLYNELYDLGYSAGEIAGESSGYDEGLIVGREEGWQNGYNAGSSSSLGENLIVDLFDAPIQVIDNIVLYENTVAGVTFTVSLWNVLTSVIIICILTWILKLISGG